MTRQEEIRNTAIDYAEIEDNFLEYDDCGDVCDDKTFIKKAFIEGAKWADKNPKEGLVSLDKACKWLENRDVMEKILHCRTSLIDDYVKAFRKAMEE